MKVDLEALREQMKEDFRATMVAMATQRDAVNQALKAQEEALRVLLDRTDASLGQVIRLTDQIDSRVEDHEQRLRKLEENAA